VSIVIYVCKYALGSTFFKNCCSHSNIQFFSNVCKKNNIHFLNLLKANILTWLYGGWFSLPFLFEYAFFLLNVITIILCRSLWFRGVIIYVIRLVHARLFFAAIYNIKQAYAVDFFSLLTIWFIFYLTPKKLARVNIEEEPHFVLCCCFSLQTSWEEKKKAMIYFSCLFPTLINEN